MPTSSGRWGGDLLYRSVFKKQQDDAGGFSQIPASAGFGGEKGAARSECFRKMLQEIRAPPLPRGQTLTSWAPLGDGGASVPFLGAEAAVVGLEGGGTPRDRAPEPSFES